MLTLLHNKKNGTDMLRRSGQHALVCIALLGLVLSFPAIGHEDPGGELNQLVKEAELIVLSRVTKIEYGMTEGEPPVPFTYVTVRILEPLKGKSADGNEITMRFLGGPAKRGQVLVMDGAPLFDVGDEDVLFIRGNGSWACPLVTCGASRFRVLGDRMYTDDGFELLLASNGDMSAGRYLKTKEVLEHLVESYLLRRIDRDDVDSAERPESGSPDAQQGEHMSLSRFTSMIADLVGRLYTETQLAKLPPITSTRATDPVSWHPPREVGPPRDTARPEPDREPDDPAERDEWRMLRENEGNPVLPER